MTRPTIDITCEIVRDDPCRAAIAITDGTPDLSGRSLFPRNKWFWIPREEIIDCEPPVSRLKLLAHGARARTEVLWLNNACWGALKSESADVTQQQEYLFSEVGACA